MKAFVQVEVTGEVAIDPGVRYTVMIRHVTIEEVSVLKERYPDVTVEEEVQGRTDG